MKASEKVAGGRGSGLSQKTRLCPPKRAQRRAWTRSSRTWVSWYSVPVATQHTYEPQRGLRGESPPPPGPPRSKIHLRAEAALRRRSESRKRFPETPRRAESASRLQRLRLLHPALQIQKRAVPIPSSVRTSSPARGRRGRDPPRARARTAPGVCLPLTQTRRLPPSRAAAGPVAPPALLSRGPGRTPEGRFTRFPRWEAPLRRRVEPTRLSLPRRTSRTSPWQPRARSRRVTVRDRSRAVTIV